VTPLSQRHALRPRPLARGEDRRYGLEPRRLRRPAHGPRPRRLARARGALRLDERLLRPRRGRPLRPRHRAALHAPDPLAVGPDDGLPPAQARPARHARRAAAVTASETVVDFAGRPESKAPGVVLRSAEGAEHGITD